MSKKSKMIVRTKFIDRACHWTVVICFSGLLIRYCAVLPDTAMADGNFRDAGNGAYSAPVLWCADFRRADVYVFPLR